MIPNSEEQDLEALFAEIFPRRPCLIRHDHSGRANNHCTSTDSDCRENATEPVADRYSGTRPSEDITEMVIQIIMEATGYERDEIEPDMDLREDLSIRSSRLPVIMDSVEGHFGIKIELEEFMDVRTIRDISDRISLRYLRRKPRKDLPRKLNPARLQFHPANNLNRLPEEEKQAIKRIVFKEIRPGAGQPQPVELSPRDSVAVFSAEAGTGLRQKWASVFRRDYGAQHHSRDVYGRSPREGGCRW